MTKQLSLFETRQRQTAKKQTIPHNGIDTSREAAESVRPVVNEQARKVLEFIRSCGSYGATDQEMQAELGIAGDTQRPRRDRLEKAGLIRRSGKKRITESGRMAHVWVATDLEPTWNS